MFQTVLLAGARDTSGGVSEKALIRILTPVRKDNLKLAYKPTNMLSFIIGCV